MNKISGFLKNIMAQTGTAASKAGSFSISKFKQAATPLYEAGMAKYTTSVPEGVRSMISNRIGDVASMGRVAKNLARPEVATLGLGTLGVASVASMFTQQQVGFNNAIAPYPEMPTAGIDYANRGYNSSMGDEFVNSTYGLVQGLHRGRF